MGCSPSKGKLFSKPEGPHAALAANKPPDNADCKPPEEENKCLNSEEKENEPLPLPTEELPEENTAAENPEDIKETENNALPQEIIIDSVNTDNLKKMEKQKKNKGKKRSAEKKRKSSIVHKKLDFSPHMVRAHQAAYTFLNPNISKYETLLGLLDQATQTHLSLQPMMSAVVLRFEEINQALEEMAEEGELMLKEHGDYMALPSGMMGSTVRPAKPSADTARLSDPPPDLLQQMLQHSTEKMRQVGSSVQALGDTTLEEAVEYFSSLSRLLVEKLQAKQAAEQRLDQVLARVECAAMRKSNPEDSALHSEDSGIGGENESLTGSERHRRHRESAGSQSSGSGVNNPIPNSANLVNHNEDDEEDDDDNEDDDDDDDDDYEDDESGRSGRMRSNSSPPDPNQALCFLKATYMKNQHLKRPLTANTKPDGPLPTGCVDLLLELQNNRSDLDQCLKNMATIQGNKDLVRPQYDSYNAGLRRHSLNISGNGYKGLLRTVQPPGHLAPQPPKHNSVRRLINTFSQGVDGGPTQSLANIPPQIRRSKKESGILLLENNGRGVVINGNNNNNSWPDSRDDMDMDSLPPPPPEVLMDNSFQRTEDPTGNEDNSAQTLPMIHQKNGVSQRLKASIQNVELLPNRASMKPRSIAISSARPVRQDAVMSAQESDQQCTPGVDPETEKTNCLYQQARKIIHLRNSVESSDRKNTVSSSGEFYHGELASSSLPVTAPPVSRVRLPPSCPSVSQRFPSPPVFRPQSSSKTPSRPSSPRTVTRATDKTPEEIIPSVSFQDARSVFCRNESQTPQAPGSCVLPRRWGEGSRGRLATRETDGPTRRTQSEQRPGGTSQFCGDRSSASTQGMRGSESFNQRPNGSLMTADEDQ